MIEVVKLNSLARSLGALTVIMLLATAASRASAQEEGEPVVIDEVIAQVNNEVITLSMLKREMKEAIETLKQQGKSEADATREINAMQPKIIATLINEQLLLQKGKEMNLSNDVEAEVNRRLLEIGKEQNIKTVEELEKAMRDSGLDPSSIRQTMRNEIMKQMVLGQEVDRKIFFSLTSDEVKKYFDTHRDKFRKPESIELSEIFLNIAGKPEAEVRAKAAQLVAQARSGADFGALAAANSEREENGERIAVKTRGKIGRVEFPSITNETVAAALKNLKKGEVTDPIRITDPVRKTDAYQIFRVDDRTPAGEPVFNENQVREVMTMERSPKEREQYLQKLRDEAYIKVADNYRAAVEPLLNSKPAKTAANSAPAAPPNKNAEKKGENNKRP